MKSVIIILSIILIAGIMFIVYQKRSKNSQPLNSEVAGYLVNPKKKNQMDKNQNMHIKIHLLNDGRIYVIYPENGLDDWLTREQLETELKKAQKKGDYIVYSRDDPEKEPNDRILKNFQIILDYMSDGRLQCLMVTNAPPRVLMEKDPLAKSILDNNKEQLEQLLKNGADPHRILADERPAWIMAVMEGRNELVKIFLRYGVDVNMILNDQETGFLDVPVLSLATAFCDHVSLQLLIDAGANLNGKDAYGMTPLIRAAIQKKSDNLAVLLKNGADIRCRDKYSNTALSWAVRANTIKCVELLLTNGASPNDTVYFEKTDEIVPAIFYSLMFGYSDIFQKLLIAGADVESHTKLGMNSLMLAAQKGKGEIVELLIKKGANLETCDKYRNTALMFAVDGERSDCVKILLEHGANVHVKDTESVTPIMLAAHFGFSDIVLLLLQKGADPFEKSKSGFSSIDFAKENNHIKTLNLMKKWKLKR